MVKLGNQIKTLTIILAVTFISVNAQKNEIMVGKVSPGEISMSGFTLPSKSEILIKGTGATFGKWNEEMAFVGWILNSSSREVVWHVEQTDDYDEDEGLFDFEDKVYLDKGDYEVYYSGSVHKYVMVDNIGDFWKKLFGRNKYRTGYRKDLFMTVSGLFRVRDPKELADNQTKNAIVSIKRVGDYEEIKKSFSLNNDTHIRVYALGEGYEDNVYDAAWIYDEINNKRVWTLSGKFSDHAGGGKKNIKEDERITLKKGSYTVHYSSDDSHSWTEWNVIPPHDPQFWGITIWAASDRDMKNVIPFEGVDKLKPIVEMIKIRDEEFKSQGFSLKKDMDLRIMCLGERGGIDMADYGWIVDADTKEIVWKMKKRYTDHAGGADKNRIFDDVVSFKKGNYIAYYSTDDSHSYEKWNSPPPIERERWGLTIWPKDKDDGVSVLLFDENDYQNKNLIVEITRVRDDKKIRKSFRLDKIQKVRIIALGEGDRGEMFDYGWIEDRRGNVIWEMTYRKTKNAGGASKNRLFNETIILEAGEYYVIYETDDSHSYNDWNSSPPDNPEMYGITLMREN